MSRHQPLKEFSVERRRRQRRLGDGPAVDSAEVLEAIEGVRAIVQQGPTAFDPVRFEALLSELGELLPPGGAK